MFQRKGVPTAAGLTKGELPVLSITDREGGKDVFVEEFL